MKAQFKDTAAFPNLDSLHSEQEYMKPESCELMTLFLQPRLQAFTVDLSGGGEEDKDSIDKDSIAMLTTYAPNIRTIRIDPIFTNELAILASLHRLESLNCTVQARNFITAPIQLQILRGAVFSELTTLKLKFVNPLSFNTDVVNWLLVSAPALNKLTIFCFHFKATSDAVQQFMTALATFGTRLASCRLYMRRPTPDSTLIAAHDILPSLYPLGGTLHVLELSDLALALDASDLLPLAHACPNLAVLRLGCDAPETTSRVPATVLADVAECCVALTSLGVVLYRTEVEHPPPSHQCTTLRELDTRDPLKSWSYARKFLRGLFPEARIVPKPERIAYSETRFSGGQFEYDLGRFL